MGYRLLYAIFTKKNTEICSPNILGYFFRSKAHVLILTKKWLGYVLGVFFTNSSGHPEDDQTGKNYGLSIS
jgi:hypothetical protein